jgi:hypothetical protein
MTRGDENTANKSSVSAIVTGADTQTLGLEHGQRRGVGQELGRFGHGVLLPEFADDRPVA